MGIIFGATVLCVALAGLIESRRGRLPIRMAQATQWSSPRMRRVWAAGIAGTLAWLISAYCLTDLAVTGKPWPGLAVCLVVGTAFWLSPRLARSDLSLILRRYELVRVLSTQGLLAALVAYLAWWQALAFGSLPATVRDAIFAAGVSSLVVAIAALAWSVTSWRRDRAQPTQ